MLIAHAFHVRGGCSTLFLLLGALGLQACDSEPVAPPASITRAAPSATPRSISISVTQPTIVVRTDDATRVQFDVDIPARHHGYLNRGEEGYFVPFQFAFEEVSALGITVSPVTRPAGQHVDAYKATILRERGSFTFDFAASKPLHEARDVSVSLRSQICNEVSGVCYPPKRHDVTLRLAPG